MCGIIAYNGQEDAIPYLLDGIRNLEYRGYDSFGCAIDSNKGIIVKKDVGRIDDVIKKYELDKISASKAILHTRWATHGGVTKENAHPLQDCTGNIAVVHNGIIENWEQLRSELNSHKFVSDTDTEVLAHMIEERIKSGDSLSSAVKYVFKKMKGSSSFVVLNKGSDELVAVKKGSPLVLGIAKSGVFVSSDVPSFIKHTNKVIYLSDGDLVRISRKKYEITNLINKSLKHKVSTVNISAKDAEKGSHKHFMIKEIMEQPALIKKLEEKDISQLNKPAEWIKNAKAVFLVGAGTSFHVARLGARIFRDIGITAIPVPGQDVSTYKNVISPDDVFIIISQSGETADIINSMPLIKNYKKIGLINSEGSTLAKEVDAFIDIGAGPEKAVAATKSFTLSAIYVTLLAYMAAGKTSEAVHDLKLLNVNMYNVFVPSVLEALDKAAKKLKGLESVFFIGRDYDFILALESALKMKEISYIHAEAIDASTFKHGPLALISDKTYVVAFVSNNNVDKTLYNLQEIKARHGKIIGIAERSSDLFDIFIKVQNGGIFSFVPQSIIFQLLAYKTAVKKGLDIDHPRNLAKTVTTL